MLRSIGIASLLAVAPGYALGEEDLKTALAAEFGDGFRIVATPHWLMVTDSPESSSAETARLLEATHDVFYAEWSDFGAKALAEPLVCVAFADAEGLAAYREKLGIGAPDGRGFYSLLTNRIVICGEDKEPDGMVRQTPRRKGETRKHSRTAHEAAHQLAFNSGVQVAGRPYPAWFAEGLAGNYEPVALDDTFGLSANRQPARIAVIEILRAHDDLIPLDEFVGMRHDHKTKAMAQVLYPQSAAFFRFLFNEYPDEFRAYQKQLASLRIHSAKGKVLEKAFVNAFGPVDDLEKRWQNYLDRLGSKPVVESKRSTPRRRGLL